MDGQATPELLSYETAAEPADCSVSTVKRMIKAGTITPVYLTPDCPRIPRAELTRLAQSVTRKDAA